MGFLDGLGRMMSGKAVFEVEQKSTEQPVNTPALPTSSGLRDERGYKIFPEIEVKNIKCRRNGNQITVTAWIANKSDQRIRIDSIHLLQRRTLNQELKPNESRELKLYEGPQPHNDSERDAQIIYRLQENGDQFQSDYDVEYNRESDGTWTIEELHEEGEVRDI